MRFKVFLFMVIMGGLKASGQTNKNIDFILIINDEVYNQRTTLVFERYADGKRERISSSYWPGNISITEQEFSRLIDSNTDSIVLRITDDRYVNGQRRDGNYEIPFSKLWLGDLYNIVRIYDLTKARYKGVFTPLSKSKKYTYEHESPTYTFLQIRKK